MDSFDTSDSIGYIYVGHDGILPADPDLYEEAVIGMAPGIIFQTTIRVLGRRRHYPLGIQRGFVYHSIDIATQAHEMARELCQNNHYFQNIVDDIALMGDLLLLPPYPHPIIVHAFPEAPTTPEQINPQVVPNLNFTSSAYSVFTAEESCASNAPPVMGRGRGRGRGGGRGRGRFDLKEAYRSTQDSRKVRFEEGNSFDLKEAYSLSLSLYACTCTQAQAQ